MTLAVSNFAVPRRLDATSLALLEGQVTVILGPNGAGKSTLLEALAGLLIGPATLGGTALPVLSRNARARTIGYLPQTGEVAWDVTVETLASLGRLPHKTSADEDAIVIGKALEAVNLAVHRHVPYGRLSGGERARALLARVLAGEPKWVLADEPFANLDLAQQESLMGRFRALAKEGCGVVLVLHDLAQAMNHGDRVVVMKDGRVVADGVPESVLTSDLIKSVWGLSSWWLGEPGARALTYKCSE